MPTNPFDIDALNGINLATDMLHLGSLFSDPKYGGANSTSLLIPFSTSGSVINMPNPNGGGFVDVSPGALNVISNVYTAGFASSYSFDYYGATYYVETYTLPVFGALQFSGYNGFDSKPVTLYIHGFAENGLILSGDPAANWRKVNGDTVFSAPGTGNDSTTGRILVWGIYGVTNTVKPSGVPGAVILGGVSFDKDPSVFCFAENTLIATADGLTAVQDLTVGALAVTASGEARPVKWIGELVARPSRHPRPHEVNPVCVRAHAFGSDMPVRDLRLSPGHAVYVDGVLVPVGHLVNGATIVQENVEHIRYYHVELETHDVLVAEGLPCESYLDDGNRASAVNATEFTQLYGRLDPRSWDDACAPLVADGPQLTAIQQQLAARAASLGWRLHEEADLVIEADGVAIRPQAGTDRLRFCLPAATQGVLRSTSGVLAHVMPGMGDQRRLGVAVSRLTLDGAEIALDSALFGDGFHPAEQQGEQRWRWTDGAGVIALVSDRACTIEIDVMMVAPSWRREISADLRAAA